MKTETIQLMRFVKLSMFQEQPSIATSRPRLHKKYPKPLVYIIFCQKSIATGSLFLSKNGTSLNVSTVKYTVAKYVKKAGIRKKVSVHTLRYTFGAHKADKHMSLATLQELMGHKKKETT